MSEFYDAVGDTTSFSKTVGEYDVYAFAGISGDFAPNHVNKAYMEKSSYGRLIAHGALLVGYMSRASTMICDKCGPLMAGYLPVSLGYDRVRFLHAVLIGDTITINYTVSDADPAKFRTLADVEVRNQEGSLCAVATHIMRWIARS